jgi:hypothetical protein
MSIALLNLPVEGGFTSSFTAENILGVHPLRTHCEEDVLKLCELTASMIK